MMELLDEPHRKESVTYPETIAHQPGESHRHTGCAKAERAQQAPRSPPLCEGEQHDEQPGVVARGAGEIK